MADSGEFLGAVLGGGNSESEGLDGLLDRLERYALSLRENLEAERNARMALQRELSSTLLSMRRAEQEAEAVRHQIRQQQTEAAKALETELQQLANRLNAVVREREEAVRAIAATRQEVEDHRRTMRDLWDRVGDAEARLDFFKGRYFRGVRVARMVSQFLARAQSAPAPIGMAFAAPRALAAAGFAPKQAARLLRHIEVVRRSKLFDADYYLSKHWDVAATWQNPLVHYVLTGWKEGREPSAEFSSNDYLALYPDVAAAKICPLVHYALSGKAAGRWPRAGAHHAVVPVPAGRPPTAPSDPYEVRPDEIVRAEADVGQAFFHDHELAGTAPNFARVVETLNRMPRRLRLVPGHSAETPDVSIIVPVYKQLNYTLNCLHALINHKSRFSAEVIVMDDCSPDETPRWVPHVADIRYHRNATNLGFVRNCNAGGDMARGRFIVHLNNDTRVVEGWLDELIGHFTTHPNAGLVGSKLFYPDGSLQEAGGIIWRDGSAWNYGRNDDPNRPQYCYAREVDYCSGASIAMRMEDWRALRGFDELFVPAYGEDSDLALRVRHQLRRGVWMQPLSRVIHYEGKSSGTDVSQGVKAHQVTNAVKLYERWRGHLAAHRPNAEAPFMEKDRGAHGRALVIDATTPEPDKDAGSLTCFEIMRMMQELGFKVSFAAESNLLYLREASGALQRQGVEVAYAPFTPSVRELLRERGEEFDVVVVFRVGCAKRMLPVIRELCPRAKIVFHSSDLHFIREQREAELNNDARAAVAAALTKRQELEVINRVDATIVHSTYEQEVLAREAPTARVHVFPWILDARIPRAPFAARRDIAFLGGYRHGPNVDAVQYFVKEIWPKVRAVDPYMRFIIAGSEMPPQLAALGGRDNIIAQGFVPDLDAFFESLRLSIAPIRFGAGIKGKVAMSMAHGVPVVATSCAAEGMGLVDGVHAIVRDDPAAFANAIVSLYDDPQAWSAMSRASLTFVDETYGSATGRRILRDIFESAGVSRVHVRGM